MHSNSPFSLADDVPWSKISECQGFLLEVPFEKQQELLQVWPISEGYIRSLDASVGHRIRLKFPCFYSLEFYFFIFLCLIRSGFRDISNSKIFWPSLCRSFWRC